MRFINLMDPDVLRRVVRTDFLVGNMEAIDARRTPMFRPQASPTSLLSK